MTTAYQRGAIKREYRVHCGCGHNRGIEGEYGGDLARAAERLGFRFSYPHGWMCCDCYARWKASTKDEIAASLGISRPTLNKAIKEGRYKDGIYTPLKRGRPETR